MENNTLILGQDQYYSLDCYKTQLNNNVLVVGSAGSGKTRSIVTPNLLQATGSYVISDPKGILYKRYRRYLEKQGYEVRCLDFSDPENSCKYNFMQYIRSTQDIVKVAHMLIYQRRAESKDPFWDEASQLLVQSLISYLLEARPKHEQNYRCLMKLVAACDVMGDMEMEKSPLDRIMESLEKRKPDSYAVKTYGKFRVAADRTLRSILISVNARLGLFDTPELNAMMDEDNVDIAGIGKRKTVLFVNVSDTDRSLDGLVNIFYTQAMNELCRFADKECVGNHLPVPVRFILDDFATNCKIEDFPRMIASFRSRWISTMLMIQAESQLFEAYQHDGKTIIGNCDSYLYLGGNDVETAKAIAERADVPVKKILNMPVGTNWLFRRGQAPINGMNFQLEPYLESKGLYKRAAESGR